MNNRTAPIYVFVLYDKGLVQNLSADMDFSSLAEKASVYTRDFLDKNGFQEPWDKAPKTADGYAQIYRGVQGESFSTVLWTYRFDGDESYVDMIVDLTDIIWQESRHQCEQFVNANHGHFIKPITYEDRAGRNALIRYILDDFKDPVLPSVLCNKAYHVYTIVNEDGYAIIPGLRAINRVGYVFLNQAYDVGPGFRLEPKSALVTVG